MFFFLVLSKLLSFFLSPVNWVVILLIYRCFLISYRTKKRLLVTATVIFLLFSNEFLLIKVVNAWQPRKVDLQGQRFEAGIVLGGFSAFDRFGAGYFNGAADRFVQASKLYHQGIIKKIIISGGSVWQNEPSEAGFIKSELILSGVKNADIIAEGLSRNTYENARFSRRILDSLKLRAPLVLITSALHMPRAKGFFEKAGVKVIGYPCNYMVVDRKTYPDDWLWPNLGVLEAWSLFFKEVVGLTLYKIAGKA